MSEREKEALTLQYLVDVVRAQRLPRSDPEADIFRFVAQLIKTRYPHEAAVLDAAAKRYFSQFDVKPRPFSQVVSDGLVSDVPRLRHAIENRLAAVSAP